MQKIDFQDILFLEALRDYVAIYTKDGKTYMFVYDVIANIKRFKQQIEGFDQILDAGFIFDANTLLFSAAKNGHTSLNLGNTHPSAPPK